MYPRPHINIQFLAEQSFTLRLAQFLNPCPLHQTLMSLKDQSMYMTQFKRNSLGLPVLRHRVFDKFGHQQPQIPKTSADSTALAEDPPSLVITGDPNSKDFSHLKPNFKLQMHLHWPGKPLCMLRHEGMRTKPQKTAQWICRWKNHFKDMSKLSLLLGGPKVQSLDYSNSMNNILKSFLCL